MSARIRHIKRRIRDLEQAARMSLITIESYEAVLLDLPYLEADKRLVRARLAWHVERRAGLIAMLRREEDLLAAMPKNLKGEAYDPGDEQGYRDALPKGQS